MGIKNLLKTLLVTFFIGLSVLQAAKPVKKKRHSKKSRIIKTVSKKTSKEVSRETPLSAVTHIAVGAPAPVREIQKIVQLNEKDVLAIVSEIEEKYSVSFETYFKLIIISYLMNSFKGVVNKNKVVVLDYSLLAKDMMSEDVASKSKIEKVVRNTDTFVASLKKAFGAKKYNKAIFSANAGKLIGWILTVDRAKIESQKLKECLILAAGLIEAQIPQNLRSGFGEYGLQLTKMASVKGSDFVDLSEVFFQNTALCFFVKSFGKEALQPEVENAYASLLRLTFGEQKAKRWLTMRRVLIAAGALTILYASYSFYQRAQAEGGYAAGGYKKALEGYWKDITEIPDSLKKSWKEFDAKKSWESGVGYIKGKATSAGDYIADQTARLTGGRIGQERYKKLQEQKLAKDKADQQANDAAMMERLGIKTINDQVKALEEQLKNTHSREEAEQIKAQINKKLGKMKNRLVVNEMSADWLHELVDSNLNRVDGNIAVADHKIKLGESMTDSLREYADNEFDRVDEEVGDVDRRVRALESVVSGDTLVKELINKNDAALVVARDQLQKFEEETLNRIRREEEESQARLKKNYAEYEQRAKNMPDERIQKMIEENKLSTRAVKAAEEFKKRVSGFFD